MTMIARPPKITKSYFVIIWLCLSEAKFLFIQTKIEQRRAGQSRWSRKDTRKPTQYQKPAKPQPALLYLHHTADKGKPGESQGRKAMGLPSLQ
jgi:hypothetical protein